MTKEKAAFLATVIRAAHGERSVIVLLVDELNGTYVVDIGAAGLTGKGVQGALEAAAKAKYGPAYSYDEIEVSCADH